MLRRSITPRSAAVLTIATLVIGLASPMPVLSAPEVKILGADSGVAIPGRYIVVLKNSATAGMAARAGGLTGKYGGEVKAVYERTLSGFAVEMSEAEALRLAADPQVAYVEQDQPVQIADTQEDPTSWALDRIDQRTLPLDTTYSYDLDLAPVTAYVVDTGIRLTHVEFGGRARYGWDFVDNDGDANDCHDHGTHTAGLVGGKLAGVAKNVNLVALRAFNCSGTSTFFSIQNAIEWVTGSAVKPAVVTLSLSSFCTLSDGQTPAPCADGVGASIRTAIKNSIASGLSFVISAGNESINACGTPFSQVTEAIRVGATTKTDAMLPISNWGSCVDLWAPGEKVVSAASVGDSVYGDGTGSSSAAALAAGAVARMLARPGPAKTPAEIKAQLLAEATPNVLTGLPGASPNRLLHVPGPPIAGGSSIGLARHENGRLALFGVNRDGALFYRPQAQVNSEVWSGWIQSVSPSWYSVCADTDSAARLKLVGLQRNLTIFHRSQATVNADSFTKWDQFDNAITSCAVAFDGTKLTVFGTTAEGRVLKRSETTPQGTYTPWQLLLATPPVLRSVAAERNGNGLVELFGLNRDGQIWHCWETANNCIVPGVNSWVQLDGQLSTMALGRNKNGALTVFGANAAGQLFQRQAAPGTNNWFAWSQLDVPAAVGKPRSVAAETNADGRITLVVVNTAGQIWQRRQTNVDTTFYGPWTQIDGLLRP